MCVSDRQCPSWAAPACPICDTPRPYGVRVNGHSVLPCPRVIDGRVTSDNVSSGRPRQVPLCPSVPRFAQSLLGPDAAARHASWSFMPPARSIFPHSVILQFTFVFIALSGALPPETGDAAIGPRQRRSGASNLSDKATGPAIGCLQGKWVRATSGTACRRRGRTSRGCPSLHRTPDKALGMCGSDGTRGGGVGKRQRGEAQGQGGCNKKPSPSSKSTPDRADRWQLEQAMRVDVDGRGSKMSDATHCERIPSAVAPVAHWAWRSVPAEFASLPGHRFAISHGPCCGRRPFCLVPTRHCDYLNRRCPLSFWTFFFSFLLHTYLVR